MAMATTAVASLTTPSASWRKKVSQGDEFILYEACFKKNHPLRGLFKKEFIPPLEGMFKKKKKEDQTNVTEKVRDKTTCSVCTESAITVLLKTLIYT